MFGGLSSLTAALEPGKAPVESGAAPVNKASSASEAPLSGLSASCFKDFSIQGPFLNPKALLSGYICRSRYCALCGSLVNAEWMIHSLDQSHSPDPSAPLQWATTQTFSSPVEKTSNLGPHCVQLYFACIRPIKGAENLHYKCKNRIGNSSSDSDTQWS